MNASFWINLASAVSLGLGVGFLLWFSRKRSFDQSVTLWLALTGASGIVYLLLRVFGVNFGSMTARIVLSLTILLGFYTLMRFLFMLFMANLARKRMTMPIPKLVMDVVAFLLMAGLALMLLNLLFNVKLTAFLVTSTVVSAVIGLSLQDILGNVFSGLALQFERPYEKDDWVTIDGTEGQVVETSWRCLSIRDRNNDLLLFPNSVVSKTLVKNHMKPSKLNLARVNVGVSYTCPPEQVKAVLLKAASDTRGVSVRPAPSVFLDSFSESSINYEVRFWITDFSSKPSVKDAVKTRIWYCLDRAGMNIPFPIRDVFLHTVEPDSKARLRQSLQQEIFFDLRSTDIFSPLPDAELEQLSGDCSILRFTTGEVLVKQGDTGDSLFLIQSGCVEVSVSAGEGHRSMKVAELGAGSFFGEMSLLTGDPRSATVTANRETIVVVVKKKGMERVFSMNPALAEPLSLLLEARLSGLKKASKESEDSVEGREDLKRPGGNDILTRIRTFFGLFSGH
jgi:small-conductance mechanosensitive channel